MIRVLLANKQATVRGALAALLGLEKDIEIVAEVGRTGDKVLEAALEKNGTSRSWTSRSATVRMA